MLPTTRAHMVITRAMNTRVHRFIKDFPSFCAGSAPYNLRRQKHSYVRVSSIAKKISSQSKNCTSIFPSFPLFIAQSLGTSHVDSCFPPETQGSTPFSLLPCLSVVCGFGKSNLIVNVYPEQCELRSLPCDGLKRGHNPESTSYRSSGVRKD
jgi:hypothetical protein